MAYLSLQSRAARQPAPGERTRLRAGHPLAAELLCGWHAADWTRTYFRGGYSIHQAQGTGTQYPADLARATPTGRAIVPTATYAGSGQIRLPRDPLMSAIAQRPVTVVARGVFPQLPVQGTYHYIWSLRPPSGQILAIFAFGDVGGGLIRLNANVNGTPINSTLTATAGAHQTWSWSCGGGVHRFAVDTDQYQEVSSSALPGAVNNNISATTIGNWESGGRGAANALFEGALIFDAALDRYEILEAVRSFYDVYEEDEHVFFSLGGGGQTVSISDISSASDALGIAVGVGLADIGAGADGFGPVSAQVPLGDTGAGADAVSVLQQIFRAVSDAAAASDALGIAVTLGLSEMASGADAVSMTVSVSLTDAGSASDLVSVITDIIKALTDAGLGSDAVSIAVQAAAADAGSGAEALAISVTLPVVADSGAGVDALSVLSSTLVAIADAASGLDALGAISVQVPLSDAGSAAELLALEALVLVLEHASGMDVVLVIQPGATRIARMVFTPRARSMRFAMRSRSMRFAIRGRSVRFTLN
jgi:hypothetical protein